ncbi:PhoX family phosphatase [Nakamurella sp. A5-74]|uniref:PhoX family phosphatase n=1 Tax=Nakamurella sp. A5-74 TaxID=3158264 RepID=A0AAU8DUW0_9ACTN
MLGHTAGKRSAVTCELKCANACFHPVPNESDNPTFRDIAAIALDRRRLIGLAGAGALAIAVGPAALSAAAAPAAAPELAPEALATATTQGSTLRFTPIAPVEKTVDALTVPRGYSWKPIIRWGDPVLPGAPVFDIEAQTAAKQRMQFGYNNDYTDIISTDVHGTRAVLVCNHEYVNPQIMFPADLDAVEAKRIAQAAHGFSVVELERRRPGTPWSTRRSGVRLNRRFHTHSTFAVDGPAAGSELLRTKDDPTGKVVLGTLGNCSGGTTPWGTVLTGEENFNGYFRAAGTTDSEKRYGLKDSATALGWETIEPRFDARTADFVNEPNRFGWIVEIDPMDPNSTPVKHTALGRLKHEGANVIVARSGHVVAYMGDDERFDYLYKFVSKKTYRRGPSPAARAHNKTLLTEGDLYVARFTGDSSLADLDGSGELPQDGQFDGVGSWVPLIKGGRSWIKGMSVDQVLVHTRLAADKVGATKMDRCEDVQPSLATGKVYVVCTNNTDRGKVGKEGATEPNPRNANKDGHIVELTELHGSDGETFVWNLMLVCGDPAAANTYFAGYPKNKVSPISCPDNIAFDSENNMWIATDGAPSALGLADGLFKVPLSGSERGRVQQFLAVPNQAETCGPVVHDRDGLVFVAVQHPGEEGTFAAQTSYFPDYVVGEPKAGQFKGPRPAVVQVYKS